MQAQSHDSRGESRRWRAGNAREGDKKAVIAGVNWRR